MSESSENAVILQLTATIVAAHVSNNPVPKADLPSLIVGVHTALSQADSSVPAQAEARAEPAVPIKKSIQRDYLVCLEDGKKLKMLKRHLATSYNLSPAQYRDKWGLPPDYPMVAPVYAERRSALAKEIGLGTGRRPVAQKKK